MKLSVHHTTIQSYATGAQRVALRLRLVPTRFATQSCEEWKVSVNDEPVADWLRNSAGDDESFSLVNGPTQLVKIEAHGIVHVDSDHGVIKGLPKTLPLGFYLTSTPRTEIDDILKDFASSLSGSSQLDLLHNASHAARSAVTYAPGATEWETSGSQALALGKGVCQDQAHVFIASVRHLNIPARYVVGYYLAGGEEDALHETHAWAEAWVDDLGWVGFDVTNGVCVTDHYVRLCSGLDAHDAAPIRGSVFGAGEIAVDAEVSISEAAGNEIAQMQQQ